MIYFWKTRGIIGLYESSTGGKSTGMRQPVALGMDDETARIWISLGYQYPVMEKIPETQNVESGVYSFESVAEISDTYIEDSEVSTGAGVQSRSSMKYVAGIGIIVIGSILILSVLKKRNWRIMNEENQSVLINFYNAILSVCVWKKF